MSVNRDEKQEMVEDIQNVLEKNASFYLIDFNKMSVTRATELRTLLRDNSYSIKIVKNRLALRALKADLPEELKPHFKGPTAMAFAEENPIGLAKIIKDFSTQNKILKVKAAIVEGQYLPGEKFDEIATLSSREDLIAKIGYLLIYPLIQLHRTWQAPISGFGRLLSQLKDKK